MSPRRKAVTQEFPAPITKPKFHGFHPTTDKCLGCTRTVGKGDRQELRMVNGECRRMCGTCLKEQKEGQ